MVNAKAAVRWREAAGLTQAEAARKVGIVRSYLSMIESGKRPRPTLAVLTALARTYGCSITDLLVADEAAA